MKFCNVCKVELIKGENWGRPRNTLCKKDYSIYKTRLRREVPKYRLIGLKSGRKYSKKHNQTPARKAQLLEIAKRMQEKYPEKAIARGKLRYAVKIGRIIKPEYCRVANECSGKIEAHHHKGYEPENQLVVQWLCKLHHTLAHHPISEFKPYVYT